MTTEDLSAENFTESQNSWSWGDLWRSPKSNLCLKTQVNYSRWLRTLRSLDYQEQVLSRTQEFWWLVYLPVLQVWVSHSKSSLHGTYSYQTHRHLKMLYKSVTGKMDLPVNQKKCLQQPWYIFITLFLLSSASLTRIVQGICYHCSAQLENLTQFCLTLPLSHVLCMQLFVINK